MSSYQIFEEKGYYKFYWEEKNMIIFINSFYESSKSLKQNIISQRQYEKENL